MTVSTVKKTRLHLYR